MFPGLRQRFDAALDLIVEFSTLGEYRLAAPVAGVRASALVAAQAEAAGSAGCAPISPEPGPRMGGAGGNAARAAEQEAAKGAAVTARGAAVRASLRGAAATPAARRLAVARRHVSSPGTRTDRRVRAAGAAAKQQRLRAGAPEAPEQLCLAV
jgi:hypothetical protein